MGEELAVMRRTREPEPVGVVGSGRVAIFMSTHNGSRFLAEQIDSIRRQSYDDWVLIASDDGSTDATVQVLEEYQSRLGPRQLVIRCGPRSGFAENFMSMACDLSIDAEYFAFCDQDDVWHPNHLQLALDWLRGVDSGCPALHCGRTRLISESGSEVGASPLFPRPPTFSNALVQSLAGGNTMVFNAAARRLLVQTNGCRIVSHDWWAYLLVSGAGGQVRYSETPTVDYRQHDANLVGANSSLKDRVHRVRRMLAGHFRDWNEINLAALEQNQGLLSEVNRQIFLTFTRARRAGLLDRARGILHSGVYRQTAPGNVALAVAALLGKL